MVFFKVKIDYTDVKCRQNNVKYPVNLHFVYPDVQYPDEKSQEQRFQRRKIICQTGLFGNSSSGQGK